MIKRRFHISKKALKLALREHKSSFLVYFLLRTLVIVTMIISHDTTMYLVKTMVVCEIRLSKLCVMNSFSSLNVDLMALLI